MYTSTTCRNYMVPHMKPLLVVFMHFPTLEHSLHLPPSLAFLVLSPLAQTRRHADTQTCRHADTCQTEINLQSNICTPLLSTYCRHVHVLILMPSSALQTRRATISCFPFFSPCAQTHRHADTHTQIHRHTDSQTRRHCIADERSSRHELRVTSEKC